MTQPVNTLSRFGLNATNQGDKVREDLTDIIYNISPTERPFHQNASKLDATSDLHEWPIDKLADAVDNNAHIDGDDFAGDVLTAGQRLANFQQISRKDIVVSRRSDIVRKAGRRSELNYQVAKAGRELQRDNETAALFFRTAISGNDTTASLTAGVPTWTRTNTETVGSGATSHADPTLSNTDSGTPVVGVDATTVNAMTETLLLKLVADIYVQGGDPDLIMMSPVAKQKFSNYMFTNIGTTGARIATQYQDAGPNPSKGLTVVGSVDVYVSDFGMLAIVPNRFQRSRDVFVMESEMWGISYLDGYHIEKMGKTGDSEKRVLIVDWGVVSKNEAASGTLYDVDETAAMTQS